MPQVSQVWPVQRTLCCLLLIVLTTAAVGQCEVEGEPITLQVDGIGTAYFTQFESNTASGTALLYGGVCLQARGETWTIYAQRVELAGLRGDQEARVDIRDPLVLVDGWDIRAHSLSATVDMITLASVDLGGFGFTGTALRLELPPGNLPLGGSPPGGPVLEAWHLSLRGRNFSLDARYALLGSDTADFQGVTLSTCNCPGEPLYAVDGSAARLDLGDDRLTLEGGHLNFAGLRLSLRPGLELSGDDLANLSLPVTFEYRPDVGTGLGIVAPDLELAPGLTAEVGVLGIDGGTPLQAFGLVSYSDDGLDITVGRARGGPRADFQYRQPLGESGHLSFSVRNRHEARFDYLHEGELRFTARPLVVSVGGGSAIELGGHTFLAASAQELPSGSVLSSRLGAAGNAEASLRLSSNSSLTITSDVAYTIYPDLNASQYGVKLDSRWRYSEGPWTVDVRHQRRWTDSGSPFSARLDRLSSQHDLEASLAVAGIVDGLGDTSFQAALDYDLLRLGDPSHGGLDQLALSLGVRRTLRSDWTLSTTLSAQLAGWLDPDPAGRRGDYVQFDAQGQQDEWELGGRVRYGLRPGSQGLTLLEARVAVPLEFDAGTLTPFLALDFAPLLVSGQGPRISGHGAILTWRSCCGTIRVGYRQQDDTFLTELGLAIEN